MYLFIYLFSKDFVKFKINAREKKIAAGNCDYYSFEQFAQSF